MRSLEEIGWVGDLVEAGLNDCAIARLTGLPRTTIRDWRHTRRWAPRERATARSARRDPNESCARCGHSRHRFDEVGDQYVYLLGLYLGHGYIVHHRRGVYRLTVTLDARYPGIVQECQDAIQTVMPSGARRASLSLWGHVRLGDQQLEAMALPVSAAWSRQKARAPY
jgi:hypothetical protein